MAKERAIDKAKAYREQFHADMRRRGELYAPELAGVTTHKLKRFFYLALKVGETPRQQRKAVFDQWKYLYSVHGDAFYVAVHGPEWQLTLPSGEVFLDYCVVRFPACDWETEDQMVPFVEFGVRELRGFAASTGRALGVVEDRAMFICDDGRRIPLPACTYRLLTDADLAPTRRTGKRTR